jgi:hypothetical protein
MVAVTSAAALRWYETCGGKVQEKDRHFKRTFLPTPLASPQRAAHVVGGRPGWRFAHWGARWRGVGDRVDTPSVAQAV